MSLNEGQKKAYKAVDKFLHSKEQVLAISGGARHW